MTRSRPRGRRSSGADAQAGLPIAVGAATAGGGWVDPEVATPCGAAFDGDDWLFSIDWDGSRCLFGKDPDGTVELRGLMGPITERFPEVSAVGAHLPPGTVLDGVVCMLDGGGRPDLAALALRMAGAGRRAAVFLATDVLRINGVAQLDRALDDRLARLIALIPADPHLQRPDTVVGNGRALADAAAEQGLTAILARRRLSSYRAGVASPDRLRVDLSGRRDLIVVGRRPALSAVDLVLAEFRDGRLTCAEVARLTGPPAVLRWLDEAGDVVADPPCAGEESSDPTVTWLRPRLTATVAAGSGRPGGAALVAVRDDLDPRWCVRRDPVPPPEAFGANPVRAFTPTVLHALPLDAA